MKIKVWGLSERNEPFKKVIKMRATIRLSLRSVFYLNLSDLFFAQKIALI